MQADSLPSEPPGKPLSQGNDKHIFKSNLIYLAMAVLGGLSLGVVLGLLIVVASLVAEHGL